MTDEGSNPPPQPPDLLQWLFQSVTELDKRVKAVEDYLKPSSIVVAGDAYSELLDKLKRQEALRALKHELDSLPEKLERGREESLAAALRERKKQGK